MVSVFRILTAVLLLLAMAMPAGATVVKIETAAALADQSEKTLDAALTQAVEKCIRGAAAMGLSTVWFDQAFVMPGRVVVRMLATDEDLENEEDAGNAGAVPSLTLPLPGAPTRMEGI
jgi:hypothetical protein